MKKSNKTPPHSWYFEAIGTSWSIEIAGKSLASDVRQQITRRIEAYDITYSRFREDSLASQLRVQGEYTFPGDSRQLFTIYQKLYEITGGRMTPLIGSMLEDAGYDASYSLRPKTIKNIPSFDALEWDGNTKLRPSRPIVLDVGAAGKGQLVDIIAEILERCGIKEYTIDASGDIRQRGQPQSIGLEHPLDTTKIIGTFPLQNQSLCASATNRRTWQGIHHVFDPLTKQSTNSMLATWVAAETTLVADAVATALFFAPASELLKEFTFTYITIDAKGAIDVSPDFAGQLYT